MAEKQEINFFTNGIVKIEGYTKGGEKFYYSNKQNVKCEIVEHPVFGRSLIFSGKSVKVNRNTNVTTQRFTSAIIPVSQIDNIKLLGEIEVVEEKKPVKKTKTIVAKTEE